MGKPNLRAVNPETPHARDIARREVKRFRLDREKDEEKPLPITNQSTGARNLFVNETLRRTERTIMEVPRARYKLNPYIALLLAFLSMVGIVWVFMAIS